MAFTAAKQCNGFYMSLYYLESQCHPLTFLTIPKHICYAFLLSLHLSFTPIAHSSVFIIFILKPLYHEWDHSVICTNTEEIKSWLKWKKKVLRNSYLSAEKQSLTRVTTKTVHCWFFLHTEMEIPCFWNNRPYKSPHQEIIGKMHFPCFKCVLSPWDHMPNCFDILQETKISSNICLAFP